MATRPVRSVLTSGVVSWDGEADRNFELITDTPLPISNPDNTTILESTYPAANYEDCIALVDSELYISDGVTWDLYRQSANVPDSTATTVADLASDFNDLLTSLKNSGRMATS